MAQPISESPTDVKRLKKYLEANGIAPSHIQQVEGGTANYVFRAFSGDGIPVIYKHAEPFVASSNRSIPFPLDRMDFEATALLKVQELLAETTAVQVPRTIKYDREAKVLVMSDAGKTTLKEAYSMPGFDAESVGQLLGEWLATLHDATLETDIGERGNLTARSIYRWPYSHLAQVATPYRLDVDFCKYIDTTYGSSLASDDDCVCHGDFWPGNVLLNQGKRLTVIDWEMCRRGHPALDVAQFAAEAYLLDRFRGDKGLLDAFLRGYKDRRRELGLDVTTEAIFLRRLGVHLGVHLAFWPISVKWADKDETMAVIELGYQVMRHGDAEDFAWLCDNILGGLLKQ
ncbi:MAG: hypothetical protein Q9186_002727 [Xanthomendoza sp. 1 TL-2023]